MAADPESTIVGVLGQWASGKSAAAATLVQHLGGADKVIFITDRALFVKQAVDHILGLDAGRVTASIAPGGRQQVRGEHATIWLAAGQDLRTADLNTVLCDVDGAVLGEWLDRARVALAREIRARSGEGRPIVIEAGFGADPPDHTIADLFARLEEAGVEPGEVKWILIEAGFEVRQARNRRRRDSVPVEEFARHAADGGGLDADLQRRLEARGAVIRRVPNEHDDFERFKADILAAFEECFAAPSDSA